MKINRKKGEHCAARGAARHEVRHRAARTLFARRRGNGDRFAASPTYASRARHSLQKRSPGRVP